MREHDMNKLVNRAFYILKTVLVRSEILYTLKIDPKFHRELIGKEGI